MYGRTVNGAVLGDPALTPPAGAVPPEVPDERKLDLTRDKYDKQSQK
jgi:hypothetical protein